MIRVGDYIHIRNTHKRSSAWSPESYRVVAYKLHVLTLDRLYPPHDPTYIDIYEDYVEIDEKATRMAKLKEILE